MGIDREARVAAAKTYWKSGDALKAGQVLYEDVPNDRRPRWACRILDYACAQAGVRSWTLRGITKMGQKPKSWVSAHSRFEAVRHMTLKLDRLRSRSPADDLRLGVLVLAENVAKVVYNASMPIDPFDDDSGWWIIANLRDVLEGCAKREYPIETLPPVCVDMS